MTVARLLPAVLLGGLAGWMAVLALPHLSEFGAQAGLALGGLAVLLAGAGFYRPSRLLDAGSLLLVSAAFVGVALWVAPVDVASLYLFVALALLAHQLLRFRTTVTPLYRAYGEREAMVRGLGPVFVTLAVRGVLVAGLVFLVSVVVFAAASGLILGLESDFTAFLLALALLAIVGYLALQRPRPSG